MIFDNPVPTSDPNPVPGGDQGGAAPTGDGEGQGGDAQPSGDDKPAGGGM